MGSINFPLVNGKIEKNSFFICFSRGINFKKGQLSKHRMCIDACIFQRH